MAACVPGTVHCLHHYDCATVTMDEEVLRNSQLPRLPSVSEFLNINPGTVTATKLKPELDHVQVHNVGSNHFPAGAIGGRK